MADVNILQKDLSTRNLTGRGGGSRSAERLANIDTRSFLYFPLQEEEKKNIGTYPVLSISTGEKERKKKKDLPMNK